MIRNRQKGFLLFKRKRKEGSKMNQTHLSDQIYMSVGVTTDQKQTRPNKGSFSIAFPAAS
jgi:hypothetical protein